MEVFSQGLLCTAPAHFLRCFLHLGSIVWLSYFYDPGYELSAASVLLELACVSSRQCSLTREISLANLVQHADHHTLGDSNALETPQSLLRCYSSYAATVMWSHIFNPPVLQWDIDTLCLLVGQCIYLYNKQKLALNSPTSYENWRKWTEGKCIFQGSTHYSFLFLPTVLTPNTQIIGQLP